MKQTFLPRLSGLVLGSLIAMSNAFAAPAMNTSPTLSFIEPTGTASPTESIDVRLRLTAGQGGFNFDSNERNFGLDLDYISSDLNGKQVASITKAYLTEGFACSGSFTTSCLNGPPYNFAWNEGPADSVLGKNPFTLTEGGIFDYLFGTFSPSNGPVAAGTYHFYKASLIGVLSGTEWVVDPLNETQRVEQEFFNQHFTFASTCRTGDNSCRFSRTVVAGNAVPEPGTYALMVLALGMLSFANRRRKSAT